MRISAISTRKEFLKYVRSPISRLTDLQLQDLYVQGMLLVRTMELTLNSC